MPPSSRPAIDPERSPVTTEAHAPQTYADSVVTYAQAGWPCILPVPPASKYPPPIGFTGADGRDTDPLTLVEFATHHGGDSLALRMPDGVVGIDVDQYLKGDKQKNGLTTLTNAATTWGPLPATWSSTARGDASGPGASRVLLYRVPARRYAPQLGADVEVIQRHHRYCVVWPSTNPETGTQYRWYRPDGSPAAPGEVPSPHDLAELPPAWVAGLAEGATEQGPSAADAASGSVMLNHLLADDRRECAEITSVRLTATAELAAAEAGSRHDACSARVYQLVQLGAAGHTGTAGAIQALRDAWLLATASEGRDREFADMLSTAARKAVTLVGEHPVPRDPCVFLEGFEVAGAMPEFPAADPDQQPGDLPPAPVATPRWFFPREVIGTYAFDPKASLDQPLAQAVLERTYPLLRYAYDSRGWLLRVPDRWELHGNLTERAVTLVAGMMPIGNPDAEKGSDEEERSKRRVRFNSNAGRTAVAKTAQALVEGGMHPCAVRLSDLDADPEILWAGGLPWNLRACRADAPMETWVAPVDPATPHLQTAAVMPELKPTPAWDEFTAAVWPDPQIRAWALRVLGIALTGYADRALPILLGDTGRGKTQLIYLLMSVLGSYAHAADARLLGPEGARAHQSIVFALKGRRLSFIDEGPREGKFAAERLKQLTGGGELTANQMNQNPISFRPTHTLVLTTNDEPVLTDPAVRSRTRLIPCDGDPEVVRAARAAIGHTDSPAWRAEAPGVLAKMMLEAGAWLSDPTTGLQTAAPESIRYLAEAVSADQDPVRTWVEDETEPWEAGTPSRELYGNFVASCLQANMRRDSIPSETAWGKALTRLGFPPIRDMRSKRRSLRIRQGGGFVAPAPESMPGHAGFMPGSETNPASTFSQVNPQIPENHAGYAGFGAVTSHTHAHAHAHEARVHDFAQPGMTNQPTLGLTCENSENPADPNPASNPASPTTGATRPKREISEATKAKRAAAAAEKRQAAIAQAAGASHILPAALLPDGTITEISASQASTLLETAHAELTVDVETSGYPVGHSNFALRTVQLGDERFCIVLDPADPAQAATISTALKAATILHAHSASADLVPLALAGFVDHEDAWSRMHDTVIPAKLADPASTGSDPSLKKLAESVLGEAAASTRAEADRKALFTAGKWLTETQPDTPLERSGWAQVDSTSTTMIRYAGADVIDDAALAKRLPQPPPRVLERERLAQRMTARVAYTGLALDAGQVDRLYAEQLDTRAAAGERLAAFGVTKPGSDAQVGAAVEALGLALPRTKTGKPSVAAGVLEPYKDAEGPLGDLVRARLDYQEAKNRIGLFLEGWRQAVVHGDGRVRPTVYTMEARTGRMSCVRPNLQQVPRSGGFRSCITADPGHVLISADFSSVELRVAAALSQDPEMLRMLADGVDYHQMIARIVWGPSAGKAERYLAKPMVFGRIYGSGAPGMARENGVSEAVARAVIQAMDVLTPGLTNWSRQVADGVEAGRAQFQTHSGRVVHMPTDRPYAAPNYCIQGTARELLIDALERWAQTPWGSAPLLPVHDELVVHVPEADADAATAALVQCMTNQIHGVSIIAEPSEPSFAWKDAA